MFWALSNIIDKIGVEHTIDTPQEFMFLLSQFYSIVFLVWWIVTVSRVPLSLAAVSIGVLLFVLYYLYTVALSKEDVTSVVAVHQIQPLFVMLLGVGIYQQLPSGRELLGFSIVLAGLFFFTSLWGKRRAAVPLISLQGASLLVISAMVGAIATIISDVTLADMRVIDIVGQSALGYGGAGLIALSVRKYRKSTLQAGWTDLSRKFGLIFATGSLDLLGYVFFYLALSLSEDPAMVSVVASIHPVYVFGLSSAMAYIFPNFNLSNGSEAKFARKAIGCLLVAVGVMLLS